MYENSKGAFDWMEENRHRSEEESKKDGKENNKNKLN